MGWTANSKRYTATKWYCSICGIRTPIELNPDWVAAGKPLKWEGEKPWEWFSRCSYCLVKQWDESTYDCPKCGCPCEPAEGNPNEPEGYFPGTLIEFGETRKNPRYSFEYGVSNGADWDERHQCRKCGKRWWFTNSNC